MYFAFILTAGSITFSSRHSSLPSEETILGSKHCALFNILKKKTDQEQMTFSRPMRFLTFTPEKRSKFALANILKLFDTTQCRQITFNTEQCCSVNSSFLIASLISVYAKWSDAQRPCSGSNCPGLRCSLRVSTSRDATQQRQKRGI